MDINQVLTYVLIVMTLYEMYNLLKKMRSSRKYWVRPLFHDRNVKGFFAVNFEALCSDPAKFFVAVRMNIDVFNTLFGLVEEELTMHSNRPVISAKCRLFVTLAYLAHGGSTNLLSMSFKMGLSTLKNIVHHTCDVLWDKLQEKYLAVPNRTEWLKIGKDYYRMWNLPNCIGAVDGKHINLTCPSNSGSQFYNYKGHHSMVLMAVCDANYTFTCVDIGAYGSQSDGGVLANAGFGKRLFEDRLDFPEEDFLPNTDTKFPHYFVGDAAFPLKSFLMRPYPGRNLTSDREIFNKRLSRARRVIENAFGILAARWRILQAPLHMSPSSAERVVKATVVLHNFLKKSDNSYCPPFLNIIDK